MTSHTAFFYGTLMAPPVLHRVIWGSPTAPTEAHASLLRIRPAILPAHLRHRVKGADYPAVVPVPRVKDGPNDEAAAVRGTLVTGLTDGDMWRLDIFEGDEYERRRVGVRVLAEGDVGRGVSEAADEAGDEAAEGEKEKEGEEIVEAETYIWTAGTHRLEPAEWDFSEFVRDKMDRWVGGGVGERDSGFDDVDAATATASDPTGGRGANGDISRQLAQQQGRDVGGNNTTTINTNASDEKDVLKSAV